MGARMHEREQLDRIVDKSNRYLMCQPSFFDVSYIINPWMRGNVKATSLQRAEDQWQRIRDIIARVADVELVRSRPGLPDMPFTANAGLVLDDKVVLSHFLHPERQEEEPHFERWFCDNDFAILKLPSSIPFEGAGDALIDSKRPVLWMGHGHRSSLEAMKYLRRWLDLEVLPLRLVDERFYRHCQVDVERTCSAADAAMTQLSDSDTRHLPPNPEGPSAQQAMVDGA